MVKLNDKEDSNTKYRFKNNGDANNASMDIEIPELIAQKADPILNNLSKPREPSNKCSSFKESENFAIQINKHSQFTDTRNFFEIGSVKNKKPHKQRDCDLKVHSKTNSTKLEDIQKIEEDIDDLYSSRSIECTEEKKIDREYSEFQDNKPLPFSSPAQDHKESGSDFYVESQSESEIEAKVVESNFKCHIVPEELKKMADTNVICQITSEILEKTVESNVECQKGSKKQIKTSELKGKGQNVCKIGQKLDYKNHSERLQDIDQLSNTEGEQKHHITDFTSESIIYEKFKNTDTEINQETPEIAKEYYFPIAQPQNLHLSELRDEIYQESSNKCQENNSQGQVHFFIGSLCQNILLWSFIMLFIVLCQIFCFQNQILFLISHKATEKISGSHIEVPRADNGKFLISIKEKGSNTDLIFFHGRGIANRVHNKITDGFKKYNTISFLWPGYLERRLFFNSKKFYKDVIYFSSFLEERRLKTNNKIFIFGQSFGCHPALFLSEILQIPVILENPFLSLRSVLQNKLLFFLSWMLVSEYDNSKYFNSKKSMKAIPKDILVFLSGKEDLYSSSEIKKVKNIIRINNIPTHTITNATHYDVAKFKEFYCEIDEFINKRV